MYRAEEPMTWLETTVAPTFLCRFALHTLLKYRTSEMITVSNSSRRPLLLSLARPWRGYLTEAAIAENTSYLVGTQRKAFAVAPSSLRISLNSFSQLQRRSVFIQTTETPNPESIKFIPTNYPVLGTATDDTSEESTTTTNGYYVTNQDPAIDRLKSPLASTLLNIDGVKAVFLGADFCTVTKKANAKWKQLRPAVFDAIMTWADSGQPALQDQAVITDTTILDDDDEVVAMIKELMEARIRPAVQEDGGDIRYIGFEEDTGIVTVQLAGSCVGCPSSSVTLKQGVENMLMHYIPEVTQVIALEEEEDEDEEPNSEASDASEEEKLSPQEKSYKERLAQAGIPFSD